MNINKISITLLSCITIIGLSACSSITNNIPSFLWFSSNVELPPPFDNNIKNNSLAISSNESLAVAVSSFESNILVYNLNQNKLVKVLGNYVTPRNVEFAGDDKSFYVSDSSLGVIRQISTVDFSILREINIGKGAFGFVIDGNYLLVNNQAQNTVTIIDLDKWEISHVISGFANPRQGIKAGLSGRYVYVTNFKGDDVRVIDTNSWQITQVLNGIPGVRAISISADESKLYGASSTTDSIRVVSIANNQLLQTIPTEKEPYGATLSVDGQLLATGNKESNSVQIFDMNNYRLLKTIGGLNEPRQAIIFSKTPNMIYVLQKDLSIAKVNYLSESKTIIH